MHRASTSTILIVIFVSRFIHYDMYMYIIPAPLVTDLGHRWWLLQRQRQIAEFSEVSHTLLDGFSEQPSADNAIRRHDGCGVDTYHLFGNRVLVILDGVSSTYSEVGHQAQMVGYTSPWQTSCARLMTAPSANAGWRLHGGET